MTAVHSRAAMGGLGSSWAANTSRFTKTWRWTVLTYRARWALGGLQTDLPDVSYGAFARGGIPPAQLVGERALSQRAVVKRYGLAGIEVSPAARTAAQGD
jgi:hypothetical protein